MWGAPFTYYRGRDLVILCSYDRGGVPESVLYNAFCSDSASIFQHFLGMTAPKRVEKRVTVLHVSFWFSHFSGVGGPKI